MRFDAYAVARYVLMRRSGLFAAPDAGELIPDLHFEVAPGRRAVRAMARAGVSYAVDLHAKRVPLVTCVVLLQMGWSLGGCFAVGGFTAFRGCDE